MWKEETKNIQPDSYEIKLPDVTSVEIENFFSKYKIIYSDINYHFFQITKGMQNCVNSIVNFKCSFNYLAQQTRIHFSKFPHFFSYSAFHIVNFIPFRFNLVMNLLEMFVDDDAFFNSLLFSLFLLKKFNNSLNFVSIASFIEMLRYRHLLDENGFNTIIDFISSDFATDKYKAFANKPPSKWMSVARFNGKIHTKEDEINEEEEEESDSTLEEESCDENSDDSEYSDMEEEEEEEEEFYEEDSVKIIYKNKLEQILDEITRLKKNFKGNRYSNEAKKYSSLLYFSSKFSYYLARKILSLPCEKTIDKFNKPYIKCINCSLFDSNKVEQLLRLQNIKFKELVDCNIAVDAAVFTPISGCKIIKKFNFLKNIIDEKCEYSSIFTFYLEPLDIGIHSFPIHVVIMKDGFADETILNRRKVLIENLRAYNINCIFKSTDGDHCFDADHEKAFCEYKDLLESGATFEEIIRRVKNHDFSDPWPINDPFHSFKNIRSKSLFRKIGLSLLKEFDQSELDNFINTKNCLHDKSTHGSMKDSYPIQIFGFESFIKSKGFTQSHFFICSVFLLMESIRNARLTIEARKQYLNTSFLFMNYYIHLIGYMRTITTRMSLIRILNTIIGLYICMERGCFNCSHVGTHPLECFYGTIRIGCHFNHSIFNVLHTISRTILSNYYMQELDIPKKIYGRKNVGGAVIQPQIDAYGYFPVTPDEFFIIFLKKLYGLKVDESSLEKVEKWYEYLIKNHRKNDDCELYQQGTLAGVNITSRNIYYTNKRSECPKKSESTLRKKKPKSHLKSVLVKKYSEEIKSKIISYISRAIEAFKDNAMLITNKLFGFILNKKEQAPKESDPNLFIYNIFINCSNRKRKNSQNIMDQNALKRINKRSISQPPKSSLINLNPQLQFPNNIQITPPLITKSQPRPFFNYNYPQNINFQILPSHLSPPLHTRQQINRYIPSPILNNTKSATEKDS